MTSSQSTTTTTTTANSTFISSHRNTALTQLQSATYGQSFSGSETDVSTSTENLSPEERYALEHTQRQEPQGQENVGSAASGMAGTQNNRVSALTSGTTSASNARSNESNASISSSTNTLIIHNSQADDLWSHRWLPGGYSTPVASRKSASSSLNNVTDNLNFSTSLINSSLLLDSTLSSHTQVPSYLNESGITGSPKLSTRSSAIKYHSGAEFPDIPSSYLDNSEVLKHLLGRDGRGGQNSQSASSSNSGVDILEGMGTINKSSELLNDLDTTVNYVNYPPPPVYPLWRMESDKPDQVDLSKASLSKSQPDLSKLGSSKEAATSPRELLGQRIVSGQTDHSDGHLQEKGDMLIQENHALKTEIDMYRRKVAKLQRFEMEIIKVHEAHKGLVNMSERREQLERLARHKLHTEVRRLTDLNADLKDQVDVLSTQVASRGLSADTSDSLRKELNHREAVIAKLVSQNKELIAAKERQEIELTAQRQTLNEQRTHIDVLDSALTNAQANVVKLEEELRKKQNLVEQAGQLKRLLYSQQLASDRRELSEKNLRQKLEKEIEQLRMGFKQEGPDSKLSDLRREIREKEEKIMVLEGEVTKWEQRYLQESALRQLAIEAASMPKDAKIAALEKNSQESERRIAQAKSDKIRHMDEIHNMNKKQAEYESRNRELETQIAEKNAMIRVLQRKLEEKEAVYKNALVRSSLSGGKSMEGQNSSSNTSLVQSHSAQASTAHSYSSSGGIGGAGAGSTTPSTPRRDEELGQESQASGLLYPYKDRFRTDNFGGATPSQAALHEMSSLSSDDLLVDNEDEGVLGKLGVVCFPGLAHPGLAAGEGTFSKSLLACVEPRSSSLVLSSRRHPMSDLPPLSYGVGGLDPPPLAHGLQQHGQTFDPPPLYATMETSTTTNNPVPLSQRKDLSCALPSSSSSKMCHETSSTLQFMENHPKCDPPPYHGHHELLTPQVGPCGVQSLPALSHLAEQGVAMPSSPPLSPNLPNEMPLPRPPLCRNPHHPTVACRKCNSVRSSNRQNAAILVRRANSSAGQVNRNSAPVPGSQNLLDADDAPSILARLRREWHLGNIPPKGKIPLSQDSSTSHPESPPQIPKNKGNSQTQTELGTKSLQQQQQQQQMHLQQQQQQYSVSQGNAPDKTKHLSQPTSVHALTQNNARPVNNSLPSSLGNQSRCSQQNSNVLVQQNSQQAPHTVSNDKILLQSENNRNTNASHVNENNNRNQLNNNSDDKIELIILEDSDQLKTPQDSSDNSIKSMQDVI